MRHTLAVFTLKIDKAELITFTYMCRSGFRLNGYITPSALVYMWVCMCMCLWLAINANYLVVVGRI